MKQVKPYPSLEHHQRKVLVWPAQGLVHTATKLVKVAHQSLLVVHVIWHTAHIECCRHAIVLANASLAALLALLDSLLALLMFLCSPSGAIKLGFATPTFSRLQASKPRWRLLWLLST